MLLPAQFDFVTCRDPFPAFVGGFGSGKTAAAIARAMALKTKYREQDVAYYLPTFPLVEDIALKRFPELCERKGWAFKTRGGTSPHIEFPNAGRILFRSMSNPNAIVGYEVAHSICDELDTLAPDVAKTVWNKIIARNRQKMPDGSRNSVAVATTPEGFRFVYDRWHKNPAPGYRLFRSRTRDNSANLPEGYIENLENTYSPALLRAYLDGEFVNLTSGTVYSEYDRAQNESREYALEREPLHVGMDFNVGKMAAVVHVKRDGDPHAVDEITGVRDTPAMIATLKAKYEGHPILVYPDASGGSRKTVEASVTDLSLLRQAKFRVCVNPRNPAVKDRVLSVNHCLNSKARGRRYRVNSDRCPNLAESFEKQAYDKHGAPDKTTGFDHVTDAAGYFITYSFPIVKRSAHVAPLVM